jgi:hypothetical protein
MPQARVFRALQGSRVFRRIFRSKTTPDYPHPLLLVADDNQGPGGAVQGLELEVKALVRVTAWDEKHACAHVQHLGWNPTERDVVVPLETCPNGKRDGVEPGAVLEVGTSALAWQGTREEQEGGGGGAGQRGRGGRG